VIRYSLSLLLLVLAALVVQQFIPTLTGLYNSRLFLVTLVFLCGSVTVGPPVMLMMAFLCGFLWDTQNVLTGQVGDPQVYKPVEMMHFGYSIILYGVIGYLMQGIQPLFRQGKWQFSTLLVGISIFVYQLAEYLLINFIRGGFVFNQATLLQIWFTSVLTMLFSPLVFWVLFKLADACGYKILFDGLKKERKVERKRLYP
jgi:cell shape-determining protein MreD